MEAELCSPTSQAEWLRWLLEDSLLLSAREKQQVLQQLASGEYSAAEQEQMRDVLLEELRLKDQMRKEG